MRRDDVAMLNLPASCVALEGSGVLLLGESGSGKSDLALRLIHAGAVLVADDQVMVEDVIGKLRASCAPHILGLLELRGIGILTLPYQKSAPLTMVVQLTPRESIERLPAVQNYDCLGHSIPLIYVDAHDASAAARVSMTLQALLSGHIKAGVIS